MNAIDQIIYNAIEEELPTYDITTESLFKDEYCEALLIALEDGVVSGVEIVKRLYEILDDEIYVKIINHDGIFVEEGNVIAIISGNLTSVLKGKQIAINFISRMSGIATKTRKYVESLENSNARITDTRNYTPNLRIIERLAVSHGGAINHRENLSDQVHLETSHIMMIGSVKKAVDLIHLKIDHNVRVIVEVTSFEQFIEAIQSNCDIIFFRDMSLLEIRKCVELNQDKLLEANENDISKIGQLSKTGVDFISVNELTHSYKSMSFQLKMNV